MTLIDLVKQLAQAAGLAARQEYERTNAWLAAQAEGDTDIAGIQLPAAALLPAETLLPAEVVIEHTCHLITGRHGQLKVTSSKQGYRTTIRVTTRTQPIPEATARIRVAAERQTGIKAESHYQPKE